MIYALAARRANYVSWGASSTVCHPVKGCNCLPCTGAASACVPGCHFKHHNIRKMPDHQRSIQRRATNVVKDLEGKPYEESPRSLGFSRLEETERRPHCSLQLPLEEDRRGGTLISSRSQPATGFKGMAQSCVRGGLV